MPANFEGACPAADQLSAFLEGKLEAEAARPLERHLRHCDTCQEAAASGVLEDDIREVDALAEGQLIADRFTLQTPLEQSARAESWRAFDSEQQRPVAVDFLRVAGAPQVCALALLAEARKLSSVKARGIAPLYDAGFHEGLAFTVTDVPQDESLSDWSGGGSRPWREVVRRFLPLCEGLAEAHRAGLVHGAIGPLWIRVDDDGALWLRGFGLLSGLRAAAGVDSTATAFSYAAVQARSSVTAPSAPFPGAGPTDGAPEQLSGREPTAASDIFGLCCALYEALTGMKPFIASKPEELLAKMTRDALLFPSTPRLPASLRRVLARGLAFHPAKRFESGKALADALRTVLGQRRRRLVRAGTFATLTGTVALLAFGAWKYRESSCHNGAGAMAQYFGPSAAEGWRKAWQNAGPAAGEGLARFDALLRAYGDAWSSTFRTQCEAPLRGSPTDRSAGDCLDEQAALLGTMGALAREGGPRSHVIATRALHALESPTACAAPSRPGEAGGWNWLAWPWASRPAAPLDGRLLRARVLLLGGESLLAEREARAHLDGAAEGRDPRHQLEALSIVGEALTNLGRHAEAAPLLKRAAVMAEERGLDSLRPEVLLAWAQASSNSASTAGEAALLLDSAEAASRRLGSRPAFAARARTLRARLQLSAGRLEEAEALLEQALQLRSSVETLTLLGDTLMQRQRATAASARYAEALSESRGLLAPDDALGRKLLQARAQAVLSAGKLTDALPLLEADAAAAPSFEEALKGSDVDALMRHARLRGVKGHLGQLEPAVPQLEQLVQVIQEKKLSPTETEEALRTLAELLVLRGEGFKGALLARENLLRLSGAVPASSPLLARARCTLGQARLAREDVEGALSAFQEGIDALPEAARSLPDAWCLYAGTALAKVELGDLAVEPQVTHVLEHTVSADTTLARRSRAEALYARARVAYFNGERDRGPELVASALRELDGLEGTRLDAMRRVIQKLPEEMTGEKAEEARTPTPTKRTKSAKSTKRSSRRRMRTAD